MPKPTHLASKFNVLGLLCAGNEPTYASVATLTPQLRCQCCEDNLLFCGSKLEACNLEASNWH
eukprot:1741507-Amphidinium_carterae.1